MASLRVALNNARSNTVPIRITDSSFGIFTANSSGSGPGILYNFISQTNQPSYSLEQAASPGQALTLWVISVSAASECSSAFTTGFEGILLALLGGAVLVFLPSNSPLGSPLKQRIKPAM